ncbi:MAG: VWA domain-containing protein [Anaerolineae bacterium]|nr:VWA domain-containing protein [Anaerolineae bacterium]
MPNIDANKDYYAILGVSSYASVEEIRHAYRELARRYHPDSGGDTAHFRSIQEAYEVLRDLTLRRAYDRQREARGFSQEGALSVEILTSRTELPLLDDAQVLYVLVDIRPAGARELTLRDQRLNLALVIDRSTSMRGVRMRNVKIAAMDLLESLHTEDRLALVAFSDRAEILTASAPVKEKRAFSSAVAALSPGGGTEIYQGLLTGLHEVRRYHGLGAYTSHVILLTDGRTYGDEEFALQEARQANAEGISISALGIGEDWNDAFLDSLARYGGGVAEYISVPSQVQDILRRQIQELNMMLVRKMTLKLNLASYVTLQGAYRVAPYMETFNDIGDNRLTLGKLTAEEPVVIVLELLVDKAELGERRVARFDLEAEEISSARKVAVRRDVQLVFSTDPVQEIVPPRLLNFLSRLSIYRLQENAWQALEVGDSTRATRFLQAAATRLFDMEYRDLALAAMLEVDRISKGLDPSGRGRKKLRYGTRSLSIPSD